MEEWSCQFVSALVEQLEMSEYQVFTVTCTAHLVTILASRQVIQEILDLLFDKCLEDSLELGELRVLVRFAATKHLELILNKLETLANNSTTKKNKFLKFIKEKLNEEKKGRDNTLLFSCLSEAIENSPLKELGFCAEGVTKKFLHPFLSSVKDFKDKSLESALICLKTLSDMSIRIKKDDQDFKLSQKDELLQFVLSILQHENASGDIKINAISTLTSMTQLSPHVGQLTRYSILESTFSTFFSNDNEDLRPMIDEMLTQFSAQDSHSSVVEEIFSLLEDKILVHNHRTKDALEILLVILEHFSKSATKEEKFTPAMLGVIISKCFHEDTGEVAKKCFQVLVTIYAFGRDKAMEATVEESKLNISETLIGVVSSEHDLSVLMTSLCDHLESEDIAKVILDIVTATRITVLTIPGLVTKISSLEKSLKVKTLSQHYCSITKYHFCQTPGVSDILLSLTRHDVGAVVTTLLMMDNVPAENISSIWSGLGVDQEVAEQLLQILLEYITFEKIRQNLDETSSSRLTERLVMALSVILEGRKLSDLVR